MSGKNNAPYYRTYQVYIQAILRCCPIYVQQTAVVLYRPSDARTCGKTKYFVHTYGERIGVFGTFGCELLGDHGRAGRLLPCTRNAPTDLSRCIQRCFYLGGGLVDPRLIVWVDVDIFFPAAERSLRTKYSVLRDSPFAGIPPVLRPALIENVVSVIPTT